MKKLLLASAAALFVLTTGPAFAGDDDEVEPGSSGYHRNLQAAFYGERPCGGHQSYRWRKSRRHGLRATPRHRHRQGRHWRYPRVYQPPADPDR